MAALRPSILLACLAFALAGCAAEVQDPAAPSVDVDGGPRPGDGMRLVVPHIGWTVGDWWAHEWDFLGNGPEPFTVKAIVAGNDSGAHVVATDALETAVQHAAFFFMDLGRMQDGTMVQGQWRFPWYQFPLQDNATWTASEVNLGDGFADVSRTLSFRATQMGSGDAAHFMIEAREGDVLYAMYDYQPALRWFSAFTVFGPDPETGEQVPRYTITNLEDGRGHSGPVFSASGELALGLSTLMHPGSTDPPAATGQLATDTSSTHVFAIVFSFGAGGAHHAQLTAPDGQHWEATALGDPDGNNLSPLGPAGTQVLVPNVPGQWHVALGGAGVVSGGGCYVWTVTVTEASL